MAQFTAFLMANRDILDMTTGLMESKLAQADLLQPLQEVVSTIKRDRSK